MRVVFAVLLVALTGCSHQFASSTLPDGGAATVASASSNTPIEHVVIIVQENRTVDNLFNGYPGADTLRHGTMSNGRRVALQQVSLNSPDIDNSYGASIQSYDGGKMDGFDK